MEFAAVAALIIFASATAFIWFPVAAAATAIAGLGFGVGWAMREVWSWHLTRSGRPVHPMAKIIRRPNRPRPVAPAASL